MTGDKSIQRAGDYANQTVIGTQINGITEERATQIAKAQASIAIREHYQQEAAIVAHGRITRADQKIIAKLTAQELLDAFGEPAFLAAFQRAQIGAAQTDNEDDYDILANLLAERAKAVASAVKSATLKAIEIVDLVDEKALHGLTCLWLLSSVSAVSEDPAEGLDALEVIYNDILPPDLPGGRSWLGHLDSLNLIREDNSSKFKPFVDVIVSNSTSWVCQGYTEAEIVDVVTEIRNLAKVNIDRNLIREHPYKAGYLRFKARSRTAILDAIREFSANRGVILEADTISKLEDLLEKMDSPDEGCKSGFEVDLMSRPTLKSTSEWLSQFEHFARLTPIGTALAYTNAKRFHPLDGIRSLAESLEYT
ncbi:LPO_1073/Vpar_1526 family protein [Nocardia asiatica]|uniref:LPO_1073/Vpar_1526 family protein n=1 Tax=Nocardia asiatica TaxID=209252 RepID=UPI0024582557|nr:LPO_1073/Vpar_1526 family protein [Nocardia asiatica]